MDYVLGLDQGRSKTVAAVAALDGEILGTGRAPGGHHYIFGMEHAKDQLRAATDAATAQAGLAGGSLAAVGAGLAGADFDYEYRLLEGALSDLFPAPNTVKNDCIAALYASTSQPGSLVICAGTGLNIGLLAPDGHEYVFGYTIDDLWHGGAAIGRKAMFSVLESSVGVLPPTGLTAALLAYYEAEDLDAFMDRWFKGHIDKVTIKDFAPEVDRLAGEGDEVAAGILREFAGAWARYAAAGMRRHGMAEGPATVWLAGNIFKSSTTILPDTITEGVRAANPAAVVRRAACEPVVGAVALALEQRLGSPLPPEIRNRLNASAERQNLTNTVPPNTNQ